MRERHPPPPSSLIDRRDFLGDFNLKTKQYATIQSLFWSLYSHVTDLYFILCLFLSSQFTLVEVGTWLCICVFGVFPQRKGEVILQAH